MLGSHHIVYPVMRLDAEVVRTRMNSAASPHHRILSAKSEDTVALAAPLASVRLGTDSASARDSKAREGSPVAHHRFRSRTRKSDPVTW